MRQGYCTAWEASARCGSVSKRLFPPMVEPLAKIHFSVTPAKAGVQRCSELMDSRFRGNDGFRLFALLAKNSAIREGGCNISLLAGRPQSSGNPPRSAIFFLLALLATLLSTSPLAAQEEMAPLAAGPEVRSILPTIEDIPELRRIRNDLTGGASKIYLYSGAGEGRLQSAKGKLEAYLAKNPGSAPALLMLGTVERRLGLARSAGIDLEKAARSDPGYGLSHYNLALHYHIARKFDEAEAEYRKAYQADPSLFMAHYNLGVLHERRNRPGEAEREYVQAKTMKPDFLAVRINLGNVYASRGRLREAMDEYRQALTLDPKSVSLLNNIALVHGKIGEYDRAAEALGKAVEIAPDVPDLYYNLARILYLQGKYGEGAAALDRFSALVRNEEPDERSELARKMAAVMKAKAGDPAAGPTDHKPR